MKAFLQEYGFSILAAIVVILLIMMLSPVGVSVKESLSSVVSNFGATAESGVDNVKIDEILNETITEDDGLPHVGYWYMDDGVYLIIAGEYEDYRDIIVAQKTDDDKYAVLVAQDDVTVDNILTAIDGMELVGKNFDFNLIVMPLRVQPGQLYKVQDPNFNEVYHLVTDMSDGLGQYRIQTYAMYDGKLYRSEYGGCSNEIVKSLYTYENPTLVDAQDYEFVDKRVFLGATKKVKAYRVKEAFHDCGDHCSNYEVGTLMFVSPAGVDVRVEVLAPYVFANEVYPEGYFWFTNYHDADIMQYLEEVEVEIAIDPCIIL